MHKDDLLFKELSYQIQGAAIEVRKDYSSGHKESIYQNGFAEELTSRKISFEKEKKIAIFSPKTDRKIGIYQPDFVVDGKIVVEMKAIEVLARRLVEQLFDYLKNSQYELGYFINFGGPKLFLRRIIYTNDRKSLSGTQCYY